MHFSHRPGVARRSLHHPFLICVRDKVRLSRGGRVQDPMGDSASNIGRAGHNQRHQTVLRQLVLIMQGVWSRRITSATRTTTGGTYVSGRGLGEARARGLSATSSSSKDPLSSNVEDIGRRGAFVGFGNTAPGTLHSIDSRRYTIARVILYTDSHPSGVSYLFAGALIYKHASLAVGLRSLPQCLCVSEYSRSLT